jgi:hypothetical protein
MISIEQAIQRNAVLSISVFVGSSEVRLDNMLGFFMDGSAVASG